MTSIQESEINYQNVPIQQLVVPCGTTLTSDPSLVPNLAALALDLSDTSKLYLGNGSIWQNISGIGGGDVFGPSSSINNDIVTFNGTTGKIIKDSLSTIGTNTTIGSSDTIGSSIVIASNSTVSGSNSGDITLGAVDSAGSSNTNGATLTGQVLNLNSASVSEPGVVNTIDQSFLGTKFFTNGIELQTIQSVGDNNVLGFYESSMSQMQTWTGTCLSASVTQDWGWERIGNRGFVDVAEVSQTAGSVASLITGTNLLPSFMTSSTNRICIIVIQSNGVTGAGTMIIEPDGTCIIGVGYPSINGTLDSSNYFSIAGGNNGFVASQGFYLG